MTRTDSRSVHERKMSVTMRVAELRRALSAAERAEAEIDTELEAQREAQVANAAQ